MAARENLTENFETVAPAAFNFDEKVSPSLHQNISQQVEQFYFGEEGFTLTEENARERFSQLSHIYSDRLFISSAVKFMNLYAKVGPTYPYLYTYNKHVGIEFGPGWIELGQNFQINATHADELDMLFSPLGEVVCTDPGHAEVSKSITKLWASFIKDGVPSATYGTAREFAAINPEVGLEKWYRLDTDTELLTNIFAERIALWEGFGLSDNDFVNCYC